MKKLNIDKKLLYALYINQKKSTKEIGKIFNCNQTSILNYLRKYDIPIRHKRKLVISKSTLYNLYIEQNKSINEISKIFNCSIIPICHRLCKYNISVRPQGGLPLFNFNKNLLLNLYIEQKKTIEEVSKILKCSSTVIRSHLHKYNIPAHPDNKKLNLKKSLLFQLYIDEKKSLQQIGRILNCAGNTILCYLRKYNIPTRLKRVKLNKSLLYDLYIKQSKFMVEISKILDCDPTTICAYLHKYNISISPKDLRKKQSLSRLKYFCNHPSPRIDNTKFKNGYRKDLGNRYFRSSWEANFARFLNYIKKSWKFEPKAFLLSNGTSYRPDFWVDIKNGIWIEIKGWMRDDAKRKIDLFRKEYPNESLELVDSSRYQKLVYKYKDLIPNWE